MENAWESRRASFPHIAVLKSALMHKFSTFWRVIHGLLGYWWEGGGYGILEEEEPRTNQR